MTRTFNFLLAAICCSSILFGTQASAQYTLTVEASTPALAPGTTYRFYVDMTDATDRMSAIFGNDQSPLEINTPDGAFSSSFNASWSASGINPAFLGFFPEMADDTYATIGLDGPAVSPQADPSLVEDADQAITPFFTTNGATSLLSNTLTGSSYYVLNTAANGLPDANLRVLVLQVTTTGAISGTLNYQVFPLGVGADQVQISMDFDGVGTFGADVAGIDGCMDDTACNFDDTATNDDGSCLIPVDCDFCFNGAVTDGDTDGDGVCNNEEIPGCQDVTACNYDSVYTDDADNCYYAAENGWCDCDGNVLDECGTCGGSGIPEGDCDCDGNVLDECGTCGGSGIPEGECD
jgi:hypothetical protein